jgi:hypothetical protein
MVDDGCSYLEDMEPQEYDIHIYYNEILVPKQHGNVKYLLIRYTVLTMLSPLTSFEMYVLPPSFVIDKTDRSNPQLLREFCVSYLPWFQPVRNSLVKILLIGSNSLATAAWTIWLYLALSEDRYVALSSCSRLKQN